MKVLAVVQFMILVTLLDVVSGNGFCDREFRRRRYIPNYAKGLKSTDLEVQYGQKPPVKCGETVSLIFGHAFSAPTLKYDVNGRCANVSVITFIPDNLVKPPYPVWIVHNIPWEAMKKGWSNGGSAVDKLNGNKQGDVKSAYDPSKIPQEDLGLGRKTVVFFVYCQCHYISDLRPFSVADRSNAGPPFNVTSYAAKHGLKCPVAGLFIQSTTTGLVELPQIVMVPPVKSALGVKIPIKLPVPTK